jgi:hypothetical protein
MKRILIAIALAAMMLLGTTATAVAFVPPGNTPEGLFSCVGGPVAGFPGEPGQSVATDFSEGRFGAWSAHINSAQILEGCSG